ncbi:MAG: hypothetical protein WAW85_06975, partial [Gordonia sp. (in: high G+C Gram-positive bacteria)]|uniref:hypothetical protein n=1 Tax=Gordonia sp. (in: high G+C Gram-positive bacteria) TaxID=84139 RepID=UPI003BB56181
IVRERLLGDQYSMIDPGSANSDIVHSCVPAPPDPAGPVATALCFDRHFLPVCPAASYLGKSVQRLNFTPRGEDMTHIGEIVLFLGAGSGHCTTRIPAT